MGLVYQSSDLAVALHDAFTEEGRMPSDRMTARYVVRDELKERFDNVLKAYTGEDMSLPFNKGNVLNIARSIAADQAVCKQSYKVGIYQNLLDELEELYHLFTDFNLQTIYEVE